MIRLILAVIAIVLYLILTIPVLWILKVRERKNPEAANWRSFYMVRWIFRLISRLAGIRYEVRGLEIYPVTVRCFMWETTEAILIL
mgnify:CR=1 FL=1